MLKDHLAKATKAAMREKEKERLSTLRLINAAIKDSEIKRRVDEDSQGLTDEDILAILAKMIKQRRDSAKAYEEGGRIELAEQERAEIKVIEEFLPKQLSQEEVEAAVSEVVSQLGACSVRDMGKVMGALKEKYQGRMDFGAAGATVKAQLGCSRA